MNLWNKLKIRYRGFIQDQPGQRFLKHYELNKIHKKPWTTIIELCIAFFLFLLSILFGFTPVIPGFIFALVAMGIIASHSRFIAKTMDKLELSVRKLIKKF